MPVELTPQAVKWLQSLKVISGQQALSNGRISLLYNDQMYLQNGFIVGQILRSVLKASGSTGEGLLRVRKIAHISSNQNWRILGEILSEIGFREFDPEEIDVQLMQDVIEFLFNKFSTKPSKKKQKVTHIDTHSFQTCKPIEQAKNLLEFMLLTLNQAFSIQLTQIFGLLVDKGRYLIQTIILGTNDRGYQPVVQFYQVLIRNVPILNELLAEQYGGEDKIMDLVGVGLLSENPEVCQLCCLFLESVDSEWIEGKGLSVMLRSTHSEGLDLLMRRLSPNFDSVFNNELYKRFDDRFLLEMKVYARLVKYYYHSLHGKQLLKHLQIPYYTSRAFELFEPDRKERSTSQERVSVRYLFCVAYRYFSRRLGQSQMSKLFYCFDPKQTQSMEEQIASLGILFQLLYDIISRQRDLNLKLFKLSWSYYQQCSQQIKTFVLDNLKHMLNNNPEHFPVKLFLSMHQPTSILQHHQFSMLMTISQGDGLSRQQVDLMLKTCIIYYYQQLSAGGVLDVMTNLIKKYQPVVWGQQISQEILAKWTKLQIPPYQPMPAQSKKIKYRSVGLKKKEMMQFTEINRYKKILLALVQLSNRNFLAAFAKNIGTTIAKVEKSKIKQMQNTKGWLNNLLALIDAKAMELKERKIATPVEGFETESLIVDQESRYIVDNEGVNQNYGRLGEYSQNEFMKEEQPFETISTQKDPLLPFSQQDIQSYPLVSEQLFFQNFQLIYLRSLTQKHYQLLQNLTFKYNSASCLSDFLEDIGILSYLQKETTYLQELNTMLILAQDEPMKRVSALMVQAALVIFEFKKSRRVTIKCVESFYQLLEQKNKGRINESKLSSSNYKPQTQSSKIVSKVQFQSSISGLHKRNNQPILSYIDCFEIVSWLLEKSIGIAQIQPISKIVTQVDSTLMKSSPPDESILMQEKELKELQQLERIIEIQSRINRNKEKQYRSTPMKKRQEIPPQPIRQEKDVSQRWAEVQKRIILRRRQLQAKQVNSKS